MEKRIYFCADLGTSSLKAALIDSDGSLYGFARVHYPYIGADSKLDAFLEAAGQLAASLSPQSEALVPVSAICISGSGPTLVPVLGDNFETAVSLRPIYWYDPVPAFQEGSFLNDGASLFLPKLKIFINTKKEIVSRIKYFFSSQEWLSWRLGARPATVIPHDGYVPYYWDDEQCGALKINQELFPPFVKMGSIIGELQLSEYLKNSPASKLLAPGVPIIGGAADFIMALVGTGTLNPGMVCDRTGSSEGINLCVDDDAQVSLSGQALNKNLRILPHVISGRWNIGAIIPQSGMLFHTYRSDSGLERKPYAELSREILKNQSHPGRVVLETMAQSFKRALNDIEEAGFAIHELTLSGGQAADPLWNQYKADISGKKLNAPEIIHAELAGNAVLCEAAFSGRSIQETAAKMVRVKETYTPKKP